MKKSKFVFKIHIRYILCLLFFTIYFFKINSQAAQKAISCNLALLTSTSQNLFSSELIKFESVIESLISIYENELNTKNISQWNPVIIKSLLQEKKYELEKRFGNELTILIFKEVQNRVVSKLLKIYENESDGFVKSEIKMDIITSKVLTSRKFIDLIGHKSGLSFASYSPDGNYIVTASFDKLAKVWDTRTGQFLFDIPGYGEFISFAFFSPDGQFIITASNDNFAKIWDAKSGQFLFDLKSKKTFFNDKNHTRFVNSALYSPDGNYIVTSSNDNLAKIWDAKNRNVLINLKGHKDYVNFATFSPDGKYIVSVSNDNLAKVWDAKTGQFLFDLKGHSHWVRFASFSPDGNYIVTASADALAKVWDAKNGTFLFDLNGHNAMVNTATFSPNGRYIITASVDEQAIIWDAKNGQILDLIDYSSSKSSLKSAMFSPDGQNFVIALHEIASVWKIFNNLNIEGELIQDNTPH